MQTNNNELYKHHISTHSERSAEDQAAVSTLETFLASGGKINTNFSCDDKWPYHDDTFEFVPNPEISRCPEQNFIVQIRDGYHFVHQIKCSKMSLRPCYNLNLNLDSESIQYRC